MKQSSKKNQVAKPLHSIIPFSLQNYQDKTACVFLFAGCDMKCRYCYTPEAVLEKGTISEDEALEFLQSRKNLLDAVIITGGEPLIYDNIIPFIQKIKEMEFRVKIETNGSQPKVIKELLKNKLIDDVALDFKAMPIHFQKITKSKLFFSFEESLLLLIKSKIKFEVCTTVHSNLIKEKDLKIMLKFLEDRNFKGNYSLQTFKNNSPIIGTLPDSEEITKKLVPSNAKINIQIR